MFRKEFKALCAKFGEPCEDSESEAEEDDKDEASVESSTEHEGNEESPSANLAGLYLNE